MKKITAVLVMVLSFAALTTQAQRHDFDLRKKVMFGLKAGTNFSNVYDSNDEAFNTDSKFGFVGGLFFSFPIGKYFGIQPEVLFSQKGFKATGVFLGSPYDLSRTTNFIDVPLLISIKPAPGLNILLGPQFSYLLRQTDTFTYSSGALTSQQVQEFKNADIRKNILGLVAGADINAGYMVFGLRAGWDFLNNNGDGTTTTPRYKNTWLQGTIGFRI